MYYCNSNLYRVKAVTKAAMLGWRLSIIYDLAVIDDRINVLKSRFNDRCDNNASFEYIVWLGSQTRGEIFGGKVSRIVNPRCKSRREKRVKVVGVYGRGADKHRSLLSSADRRGLHAGGLVYRVKPVLSRHRQRTWMVSRKPIADR